MVQEESPQARAVSAFAIDVDHLRSTVQTLQRDLAQKESGATGRGLRRGRAAM
jgi:hypothetical protein